MRLHTKHVVKLDWWPMPQRADTDVVVGELELWDDRLRADRKEEEVK
jgi:hypothetical protein